MKSTAESSQASGPLAIVLCLQGLEHLCLMSVRPMIEAHHPLSTILFVKNLPNELQALVLQDDFPWGLAWLPARTTADL